MNHDALSRANKAGRPVQAAVARPPNRPFAHRLARFGSLILSVALFCTGGISRTAAQTNAPPGNFLLEQAAAAQAAATAAEAVFESTNSPNAPVPATSPLVVGAPQSPQAAALASQPAEIELTPSGALARYGPTKVSFATDLSTAGGAVSITMADEGQWQLRSQIQSIVYFVPGGPSVLVAELKPSVGELVSFSQIIYPSAFDDIKADVLYSYTGGTLEQCVICRNNLPSPTKWGLDPAKTQIGVITEFINPIQPTVTPHPVDLTEINAAAGIQGNSALPDVDIVWSTMAIRKGRAFLIGDSGVSVPVGKSWQNLGLSGRWFLVESAPYLLLKPQLDQLPPDTGSLMRRDYRTFKTIRTAMLSLPAPAQAGTAPRRMASAHSKAALTRPGLVLDYLIAGTPLLNIHVQNALDQFFGVGQLTDTMVATMTAFPHHQSCLKMLDGAVHHNKCLCVDAAIECAEDVGLEVNQGAVMLNLETYFRKHICKE